MNFIALIPAIQWMAGIFLISLALYVFQFKHHPATKSFGSFLLLAGIWCVCAAGMVEFSSLEYKVLFNRIRLIAAVFIPYSIFILALRFSSYEYDKVRFFNKVFFIPIVYTLIILSPWHEIFVGGYKLMEMGGISFLTFINGPAFYFHNLSSRIAVIVAIYLFIFKARAENIFQRKTSWLLVLSILLPFVVDTLGVLFFSNIRFLQLVPVTLSFTGGVITYAIFYHQSLKIIPFGRSEIVSAIDYPCLMWDRNGVLADANPAASRLFEIGDNLVTHIGLDYLKKDHQKIQIGTSVYEVRNYKFNSTSSKDFDGSFTILKNQTSLLQNLEVKTKLVSILSHDIHGLVGQLLYLSDVMNSDQEKLSLEQRKKLASGVFEITSELNIFLKNTIDWSKDQFENWHVKNKSVVVKEIIDTNVILLGSLIKSKNLKLNVSVSNELILQTDESVLTIILRNLIYNAIKHSDDYSEIEITNINEKLIIKNPGGEEKIKELNEYFEAHDTSEELSANGLGIRICRDFARLINFKIAFTYEKPNLITHLWKESNEKTDT